MSPDSAARKAAELVGGERQKIHGDPKILFETIAQLWSVFLHRRRFARTDYLEGSDVAKMLALFKVARSIHGVHNADDLVDCAGYSSIGAYLEEVEEARAGIDTVDRS